MTTNRSFKQAARSRMAEFGETYMQARAALLDTEPTHALAPASQLDRYVELGYPAACHMTEAAFRDWLAPLVSADAIDTYESDTGAIGALLVVNHPGVTAAGAMQHVPLRSKHGFVDMNPTVPEAFSTIDAVTIPDGEAYVLHGFDPGDSLRSEPPSAAMLQIIGAGRSPITIAEALAAVVLHPQLVADKHAFSILASRSAVANVSQSVPAIWVSKGAPRLGWCWDNNPHTWLGSASCSGRYTSR